MCFLGGTLYYTAVKPKDNGVEISCEATDNNGAAITAAAILYVYNRSDATHPMIANGPSDIETDSGTNVNFTCRAYGESYTVEPRSYF